MALKASTGLRTKLLDTGSLKDIMDLGFIKMYAGTVPATADDAIPGGATLVTTISVNSAGTGISFDAAAVAGTLSKDPAEVWSGVNASASTVTFYRHVAVGDDGTASTTQARLQGTIGTAGADMNLSSVNLANGATQTIDYYSVTQPTL